MRQGKVGIRIRPPITIAVMKFQRDGFRCKIALREVGNMPERRTATGLAPTMSGRHVVFGQNTEIMW
jgi:hypothetical protein